MLGWVRGTMEDATMNSETNSQRIWVSFASIVLTVASQLAAASDSDSGTLTAGDDVIERCGAGQLLAIGFASGVFGSYSPTGLTGGTSVSALYDQAPVPIGPGCPGGSTLFQVTGFSSNPGKSWLISITCEGTEATPESTTSFSYNDGAALWQWANVVLPMGPAGNNESCTIVHN